MSAVWRRLSSGSDEKGFTAVKLTSVLRFVLTVLIMAMGILGITAAVFADTDEYTAGSTMTEEEIECGDGFKIMAAAWSGNSNGTYNNGSGSLLKGAVAKGIDVSKHQGNINWSKVKSSDIDYVILRCGYRDSKGVIHTDEKWSVNVAACEKYKIPYGVYFYSTARTAVQVNAEISKVKALLKGHYPAYPVYYDLEDPYRLEKQGKNFISNAGISFCKSIKASGYRAGVYASKSWWDKYLTSGSYDAYERWIAQWRSGGCTYAKRYSMWQCTSSYTNVPGISGRVDLDFAFKDFFQTPGVWQTDDTGKAVFMTYVENEDGTFDTEQPMVMAVSRFIRTGGNYYYVGEDGHKYTGLRYIGNKRYFFSSSGIMKRSGWITSGGGSYYASSNGVLYSSSLKKIGAYYYLFAADGKRFSAGTHQLNGKVYKLMSGGKACLNMSKAKCKVKYRKGPGKKYRSRGTLKKGKYVYIIRTSGSWSQASNGYWIKTKYIRKVKTYPYAAPVEPAPPVQPDTSAPVETQPVETAPSGNETEETAGTDNVLRPSQPSEETSEHAVTEPAGM